MSEPGGPSAALQSRRREMEKKMSDEAAAVLTELCEEGTLCDVVIRVGDVEFNAHKVILCSCSLYFRTLFTSAWATSGQQTCTIPGVSPEMMHLIINYAYTHSIPVTKDNVEDVLAAADQFLVLGVVQACCFFLEDQLCLTNCIGIWKLVGFYHCPELKDKAFLYVLHHFEDILKVSNEMLDLSEQQLAAILESDHLNVKRESTVFEAVLRWISYLPDQRQGHIAVLLPKVRLGLMTALYLQMNVMNNAMINTSLECMSIVDEAVMTFMDRRVSGRPQPASSNLLSRPRLPFTILLVTGGKHNNTAVTSLEVYDARADCWASVDAGFSRCNHGAAVLDGFVYLVGGGTQVHYLNTVQRFDLVTSTWHCVAPMNCVRCYVSVAVQNGCIYAMGGFNGRACLRTVECYKPETDQWTMMAPMRSSRSAASAATLNGKVYICGGCNGHHTLCTAECYDPEANLWTVISPMWNYRSALGVVAYRNRIYAIGGINQCSAEVYNPNTNGWDIAPSMHNARSFFGIAVVDDQLFVVGGEGGSVTMHDVERYDEEAGMWYRASSMQMPRSGLSCCVLHGLHDVAENLFPRGPLTLPNKKEAEDGST